MKNTQARSTTARRAAQAACLCALLFAAPWASGHQHGGGSGAHSAPAPHFSAPPRSQPRQAGPRQPSQQRPGQSSPVGREASSADRFQEGGRARPQPGYGPGGSQQPGMAPARPAYNGAAFAPRAVPQAAVHLPDWMAQHRNLNSSQQERLLREEPGFNRLNPAEQQRQIDQLHRLDAMPEAQRDRRLARAEALERLSPAEQMQVHQSARRMAALPPDRQAMMRRAFQDLRGVPVEQRDTILGSARYAAGFSPEERGILSNLLRVEPYEPPR